MLIIAKYIPNCLREAINKNGFVTYISVISLIFILYSSSSSSFNCLMFFINLFVFLQRALHLSSSSVVGISALNFSYIRISASIHISTNSALFL